MRVLIAEDGLSRQALSAARALHAAGWTVGIAASRRRGVAASSRSVSQEHEVPEPQLDQDGFTQAVASAVREAGYEVVFGARDVDVLALSERREEIPAVVPYPPHDRLIRVFDKAELNAAAERAGVAVPHTEPASEAALAAAAEPLVIKARVHATFESGEAPARLETTLTPTKAEAARRIEEIREAGGEPLIQEYLPDPRLIAFVLVADESSRLVARCQQEAEQVWPLGAGVSVRARTVPVDPELEAGAAKLVQGLGWSGLAELQFLVPADGRPRLIDFNGRFYGSLALAVGAGANLPAAWAALATGRPLPRDLQAAPGVRYQWMFGDLKRSWDVGRHGVARRMLETLGYSRGAVQSVSSLRDPLPAVRHFALVLGARLGKRTA